MITDSDAEKGRMAAQRLCDAYGKDRVQFAQGHVHNRCQFEATLNHARCKYKGIHIIFNDFDKEWPLTSNSAGMKENNAAKMIRVEMKVFEKKDNGPDGVIVNCASIFGFMGWPQDPFPIYCKKEPVIEVTKDFVKETNAEETGVRLIVLCPSTKHFNDIGLPDIPDPIPDHRICELPPCVPITKRQIGPALSHVLAWAQHGSVWLVEPAISVHETPRLIHFPVEEGETVDPKVYQTLSCSIKTTPPCVELSNHNKSKLCQRLKSKICKVKAPKRK
ncbi:uncharacterized protein LOC116426379 [Nomia melanderi]|uniref:uncharacterized protein LOC116426379 n=1 Tax=Nomia melanderi TaxID=2448451 RepID=UPI003FCE6288